MFDLELILSYYKLSEKHIKHLRSHNWVEIPTSEFGSRTHCANCNIDFAIIMHRQQGPDGVRWAELTCNELLIKKLLE